MKKYFHQLLLMCFVVAIGTGCLKDKDYEAQKYGIQVDDQNSEHISFNQLIVNPTNKGLDQVATPQVIATTAVYYQWKDVNQQDIHVKLALDTSLLAQYATPGSPITPLPDSLVSFPTDIVIPAGKRFQEFTITVTDASGLNPLLKYGIAIKMVSTDVGYINNNDVLVYLVNIKSKYDGLYQLNGYFVHPTPAYVGGFEVDDIELRTSGPASVEMFWRSADDYAHPFSNAGSLTYFASQAPRFTFNPATDEIISVENVYAAGTAYTLDPTYNNRYDPATKTIYAQYSYTGGTRIYTDTLTYLGPR